MPVATTLAIVGATSATLAAGGAGLGTAATIGAALGGAAIGGAMGYGAKSAFGMDDMLGDLIPGTLKTKTPEPVTPDPLPQKGDEGIRSGETARIARKRTVGQLYLTRGQNRNDPSTLGGIKQQLG